MQFPPLMILFIERPGTVEFEFGTLQAQSRGGLLPSTWRLIHFKGRAKNKDDAVPLFNDSICRGTVEFEFGTLQAQSMGGLFPSTWLPVIFNPAFKISP